METFVWYQDKVTYKEGFKFVYLVTGAQSVETPGTVEMHMLCVSNLDTQQLVGSVIAIS